MDGLRPKGHAGIADHPGGCRGQNILEIKNSGRSPHLMGKGEEEEYIHIYTRCMQMWKQHVEAFAQRLYTSSAQ